MQKREADWQRLAHLCAKADATLKALKPDEFEELVRLYRRASTDLAVVRTRSNNLQLADFLNALVVRAHSVLYRAPSRPFAQALFDAAAVSARTVRKRKWFVLTSAVLFFGSGFFAFGLLSALPAARDHFVGPGQQGVFDHWKSPMPERTTSESAMMTGFYLSNNPMAAITAGAAAAATFGVLTTSILFQNGALLGALSHELLESGRTGHMLVSVAPHGVPELSGIVISGAAGFSMAYALIRPGRKRRGDALKEAGQDAIVLLATAVVLMFIAAPIEGFFSFNPRVPDGVKLAVALVSLIAWLFFWSGYGREEQPT